MWDVNVPFRARLVIFARAIDGVDDPDARFAEPLLRVLAFLGQQAVLGPLLRDGMDKKLVRGLIARLAQRFAFTETRLAHGEKDFSGCSGKSGREFGVGLPVTGQCAALPLPKPKDRKFGGEGKKG